MSEVEKTTDLIAQAEAAVQLIQHNIKFVELDELDRETYAELLQLLPALIARIRELEGERDGARKANREMLLEVIAASGQAQEAYEAQLAAEAKLAEVEKERDKLNMRACNAERMLTQAEATVATLTAQVEAMRGELAEANRRLGGGCDANAGGDHHVITQGKYHFCANCGESLKGIRFCHLPRAALTTENQTNG